jgi:hypothetical protein
MRKQKAARGFKNAPAHTCAQTHVERHTTQSGMDCGIRKQGRQRRINIVDAMPERLGDRQSGTIASSRRH